MKLLEPKYRKLMRMLAIPAALIFVLAIVAMATMASTKISAAGMASIRISLRYFGSNSFIALPHIRKAHIHMANSRSSVPSAF